MQRRGLSLNPITTLYYIAPASLAFLSIPWFFIEAKAFLSDPKVTPLQLSHPPWDLTADSTQAHVSVMFSTPFCHQTCTVQPSLSNRQLLTARACSNPGCASILELGSSLAHAWPYGSWDVNMVWAAVQVHLDIPIFLSNAAAAFGLNMSVFMLIGKTSALTMNIAGVIKDWLLIALSVLIFKAQVTLSFCTLRIVLPLVRLT